MNNELDMNGMLRLFELVRQHGERTEQGYRLEGLEAWSDFDGYTIFLRHGSTILTLGFHSQYKFDYPNSAALADFLQLTDRLGRKYPSRNTMSAVPAHDKA